MNGLVGDDGDKCDDEPGMDWRGYGAQMLGNIFMAEAACGDSDSGEVVSPKDRARRGIRKRKINSSTRKKLQHMGRQLS